MMLVAVLVDIAIGWPDRLFARIGHPVTWIGALIEACEARLNRGTRSRRIAAGGATLLICLIVVALPALVLQALLPDGPLGALIGGLLAWPFVAVRAMYAHVAAVARPLGAGDLPAARQAVAMIVGRNPETLDTSGVTRSAIESLAENSADGIVAPVFWGVIAGLPGIAVYKAINTADSMIGHRSDRYEAFGKPAARLDDVVNWIPARITGGLFVLSHPKRLCAAWRVMLRDARHHRSPNAGWPESAVAGALDVRLSGPRIYDGQVAEEPWLNAGASDPVPEALWRALGLFRIMVALMMLALLALALV